MEVQGELVIFKVYTANNNVPPKKTHATWGLLRHYYMPSSVPISSCLTLNPEIGTQLASVYFNKYPSLA